MTPAATRSTNGTLTDYVALMRLDRPIGILLLLWPTLWALWLAAEGLPALKNLLIFSLGVTVMRCAGCVINDWADRDIDRHVKRTTQRPITAGRISSRAALTLFAGLCLIAFGLVLMTNALTMALSLVALILAAVYPFMKRHTHFPQVVLGAAFGWGIPMAFAAEINTVPAAAWWLFAANLTWTVAYDTAYAMVDRDDDVKIGVRSTAIWFGRHDRWAIGGLQCATLALLGGLGLQLELNVPYFVGLAVALLLFAHQQWQIRHRERDACFRAFINNNYVGFVIFVGLALSLPPMAAFFAP